MAETKTYFPAKTFDDDLDGLVGLYMGKKWQFSGVDLVQLEKDAGEQRAARKEFDSLEAQYLGAREKFGIGQEARHERFSAALNAARGAFKNDRAVLAELEPFKRSSKRAKKQP